MIGTPSTVPRALTSEPGENLALAQKAIGDRLRFETGADALQRDALLELAVGALGEEDLAHAALAETAHQAIGADGLRLVDRQGDSTVSASLVLLETRDPRLEGRGDEHRRPGQKRRADELLFGAVGGEELGEEARQFRIARGECREAGGPDVGALLYQFVENRFPALTHSWTETPRRWKRRREARGDIGDDRPPFMTPVRVRSPSLRGRRAGRPAPAASPS